MYLLLNLWLLLEGRLQAFCRPHRVTIWLNVLVGAGWCWEAFKRVEPSSTLFTLMAYQNTLTWCQSCHPSRWPHSELNSSLWIVVKSSKIIENHRKSSKKTSLGQWVICTNWNEQNLLGLVLKWPIFGG